jgi:hypothetical protein
MPDETYCHQKWQTPFEQPECVVRHEIKRIKNPLVATSGFV